MVGPRSLPSQGETTRIEVNANAKETTRSVFFRVAGREGWLYLVCMTNETHFGRPAAPGTHRRSAIVRKAGVYMAVMGRPEGIAYTDAARNILGALTPAMVQGEGIENYLRRVVR